MDDLAPVTFPTVGHVLRALGDAAVAVVGQAATDEAVPLPERIHSYAVLSLLVRRVVAASLQVDRRAGLDVVPHAGAAAMIEGELAALRKVDIDAHHARLQAMVDAADAWTDHAGLSPVRLVAELCRDFGMVVQDLPPRYLDALPPAILALTARAAAASTKPA